MILVNRNSNAPTEASTTSASTSTKHPTNSTKQQNTSINNFNSQSTSIDTTNDQEKKKFNISTFFKKIPNISISTSINSTNNNNNCSNCSSSSSTSSQNKYQSSLSPATTSQESIAKESTLQPNIFDDITISQEQEVSSTNFNQSSYTTLVHDQERYTSFTADCISLQNSEMTNSIMDEEDEGIDHHGSIINVLNTSGNASISSNSSSNSKKKNKQKPVSIVPVKKNNGIRKLLRLGSFSSTKSETIEEEIDQQQQQQQQPIIEEEELHVDDEVAYLSESESDLNFDPNSEESEYDYKHGGYHPVSKGEVYYSTNLPNREYIILRKLGWGHFSTVWLAKSRCIDDQEEEGEEEDSYVAIKFVKSSKHYSEAAEDEIRILKTLNDPINNCNHLPNKYKNYLQEIGTSHPGYNHVMKLLDDFRIEGPNGNHICMVFEILGENVLNLIYKYKRFFRNVDEEIKRKSKQEQDQPELRFNKTKVSKGNTKSMLSLNLKSNTTTTTTTPVSTSPSISPIDTCIEIPDSISSYTISTQQSVEQALDSMVKQMNSQSLMKLMNKSKYLGGIPMNFVKQIVKQMLMAMDYMHHCGIIHTDLKPENILLDIKNIKNIIKAIESQKLAQYRRESSSDASMGRSRLSRAGSSIFRKNSIKSRTLSSSSMSHSGSSNYRRSKNSFSCKHECPIRSSKPFSSSITSEVLFNDFQFQDSNEEKYTSFPMISPGTAVNSQSSINYSSINSNNDPEISIKIADLGNATFVNHHFTNQIQTRQYRSPEIILGYKKWGSSTDIWSIGCIVFELITGDFLFDPHDGKSFSRDEDHLAQIIELIGEFPSDEYLMDCKLTSKFFKLKNPNEIVFKNIDSLKYWGLYDVLIEKYKFDKNDIQVKLISDFILKCLCFNLNDRYDCGSLLNHPWLQDDIQSTDEIELKNLPNVHDELPGYTNICK